MRHLISSLVMLCLVGCQSKTTSPASTPSDTRASADSAPNVAPLDANTTEKSNDLRLLRNKNPTTFAVDVPRQSPPPMPPAGMFDLVKYPAPLGENYAYITPQTPGESKKPAILWINGGFFWGLHTGYFQQAPRENDQSATAFQLDGLVLMLPSVRAVNTNPGKREFFAGEVDDLIAAAKYLRERPDVDPDRVYLGGHSTGGTLTLLMLELAPELFRAGFALGPTDDIHGYGNSARCPCASFEGPEREQRAPITFLHTIETPTFILEGASGYSDALKRLAEVNNPHITAFLVPGRDHFSVIRPAQEAIVEQILADTDASAPPHITLTPEMIVQRE